MASSEYSQRRSGEAASRASNSSSAVAPVRRTGPMVTTGGVLSIMHRRAGQVGIARGGRRIHFAVRGDHAKVVFAVGQHVAVEGEGIVVQVALEQHPAALVVTAEIEVVNQPVAIGIFGLPANGDLLRGRPRKGLGGRAGRRWSVLVSPLSLTVTV